MQENIDLNLKVNILKEVASHMYPKRKTTEYERASNNVLPIEIIMNGLKNIKNNK